MPKIKPHKASSKRIGTTGSGKLRRRQAMQAHKLSGKTAARKRRLRKVVDVAKSDVKRLRRLIAQ